jgi:RimJ/RimL family protein N-acetyltransferase
MLDWNSVFPISLKGKYVNLVPLGIDHATDLREAVLDSPLTDLWYTNIPSSDEMETEITRRLDLEKIKTMVPFSVLDLSRMKVVGMTTFMNIDGINKRLEIGSTWYRNDVQRSPINTECKSLLLNYAFDTLGCIAVEFRTHFMNRQSRAAIERLGAKCDGILRSHMILANGTIRDTAVYSITQNEWASVRENLKWLIKKY